MHVSPHYLALMRWLLAFLFAYAAAFLHEDEEGAIQNRLEEWWIRLAYGRDHALSRTATFMRGIARLSNRAFDAALGKQLWSFQAIGVSFWFSWASFFFFVFLATHIPKFAPKQMPQHIWSDTAVALLLGFSPLIIGRRLAYLLWGLVATPTVLGLGGFLIFTIKRMGYAPVLHAVGIVAMVLVASLVSDLLYIAITRWLLRGVAKMQRVYEIVGIIAFDCLLAFILFYGPIQLAVWVVKSPIFEAGAFLILVVMLNFGDIVACSVFFVVMLFMLLHRILWPTLERPIYFLQRYRVISNKKLLWTLAGALAFGPKGIDFVKYVVDKII
jgi:hypothetical protein